MRIWMYFCRLNGAQRWYADATCGSTVLYGLQLDISDGKCKAVSMLEKPQFDEICTLLGNRNTRAQLQQSIFSRLKAFLRQRSNIRLSNADAGVTIDPSAPLENQWVLFHKKDRSRYSNEFNYGANVILPNGTDLGGVQVVWTGENDVEIRLPSVEEMIQAREFAQDPAVWNEICQEVYHTYDKRSGRMLQPTRQNPAPVPEPQAPVQPVESLSKDAEEKRAEPTGNPVSPVECSTAPSAAESAPAECVADSAEAAQKKIKSRNRYGRIKDSEDSGLLKYTPGNVLRPAAMIESMKDGQPYRPEKYDAARCIKGLSNGMISVQDIEILSHVSDFRYITSAMLIDLYGSGYIPHNEGSAKFSQDRVNKRIKNLTSFGLITPCRFIGTTDSGDFDFNMIGIGRIHVLDRLGGLLLRELGREATSRAFDVYQDGRTVRERLCVNQWTTYWMSAYPEVIGRKYGFNQVLYRLDHEMSGARMPAWVYVNDQLLIGQHVRRCDESELEAYDQEMLGKVERIGVLFEDLSQLCRFDGSEYAIMQLTKRPIINYICEDEEHMWKTMEKLKPVIPEGQEMWFTWDQGLFNYGYEGKRFYRLFRGTEAEVIDPALVFGIGAERKEEKRLDAQDEKNELDACLAPQ